MVRDVVYVVQEARGMDSVKPLRAFPSEEAAKEWRDDHVEQYEPLDDDSPWDYHLGMGGKASFPVTEVPYGGE